MRRALYSTTVRQVVDGLPEPITAGQFALALIAQYPADYGAELLPGLVETTGPTRQAVDWLDRCEALISPGYESTGIDDALVLLALGRIDYALGSILRRTGIQRMLDGKARSSLLDWARLPNVIGFTERVYFAGDHNTCALSLDGRIAFGGSEGVFRVHDVETGKERLPPIGWRDGVVDCAFSPDGSVLAVALTRGVVTLLGGPAEREIRHEGVRSIAFGGRLLVTGSSDGSVRTWNPATGVEISLAARPQGRGLRRLAYSGQRLALPNESGIELQTGVAKGRQLVSGAVVDCALSPSQRHVAATTEDGSLVVWDMARPDSREEYRPGFTRACEFSADGRVVIAAGDFGVRVYDVVSGVELGGSTDPAPGTVWRCATGPDGLVAIATDKGTTIWEPVTGTVTLAAVSPDSVDGTDLLDVAADAAALADVIAAKSTVPPLSIGLFADWGSGKSFLIKQVQARVRVLSRRAQKVPEGAAHCAYVRNVEFNAWHFADANLWASLATHILDELARPEAGSDLSTSAAASQLARLEEQLAAQSTLRERLERAHQHRQRTLARKKLLFWTWGLAAGGDQEKSLAAIDDAHGRVKLLLPNARAWLTLVLVAAVLAAAGILAFGFDQLASLVTAGIALVSTFGAWLAAGTAQIGTLLKRAGPATAVGDVRGANVAADAKAAKVREQELREELADLATGRRLARFAAERGTTDDYRSQLGVVSRIHDDFSRMRDILAAQGTAASGDGDLPRIDRIVLYIDDLDRCPPKRVVEVLEAVHLILALELFVVVLAVDPRWLLQSLQLHYATLLDEDGALGDEWKSTPLNYLEKIIQLPFTLRPMGESGTTALVGSLLPVAAPVAQSDDNSQVTGDLDFVAPAALTGAASPATPALTSVPAARGSANLSPRTLLLTEPERDFVAVVARELRTPRAVKKLTNLYRLVRARLDEDAGELDAFLAMHDQDVADYEAVVILLTMLIAFPSDSARLLLRVHRDAGLWSDYLDESALGRFLEQTTRATVNGATTTCRPFARWAVELSRYSFETGQEVYSKLR